MQSSEHREESALQIAPRLDQDVDDVVVLVTSLPEVLPLPLDGYEEFVQVSRVAQAAEASGRRRVRTSDTTTYRFIRHRDTPFGEEIFDISEIQVEAMVEPNDVTDDLEWKAVSLAAESRELHRPTLSTARQLDNTQEVQRFLSVQGLVLNLFRDGRTGCELCTTVF